jgi:hypothetical protein
MKIKPKRIYCAGCNRLFANQAVFMSHGIYDKECTPERRFWGRVNKDGLNGCWIFLGCLDGWGYGDISYQGKHIQAHRLAWKLLRGDPGELDVLHQCNNPPCCNPDHMRLGTDQDNSDDRMKAGTHYSKLSPDDVLAIRAAPVRRLQKRVANGAYRELAQKYGVSEKQIWTIRAGKQWKHIA